MISVFLGVRISGPVPFGHRLRSELSQMQVQSCAVWGIRFSQHPELEGSAMLEATRALGALLAPGLTTSS